MSPKVSVILPIYNAGHYLEQCLDSMVAQTLSDMEIICVNDGSTDGSDEVIRSYCRGDSRFSMVDKPNGGYGQSMNRGIDAAKGEYIGIVEPDDFVDPQMFERLYEAATCYTPNAQIAKGPYWRVCEADSPDEKTFRSNYEGAFKGQRQPFTIFERNDFLYRHPSIWSAIYEKSFLDEHSIRFKEIPGAGWADNPFFIQTLCQAERICYVDEAFYHYREDNISGSSNLKDYNIPFDRWNDMMDFIDEKGIRDRGVLEGQYCRAFAYVKGIDRSFDRDDPGVLAQKRKMFSRMDEDIVMDCFRIPKDLKDQYLTVVDPGRHAHRDPRYEGYLASEFFRTMVSGGLDTALYRVRGYFRNRREETKRDEVANNSGNFS